MRSIIKQRTRSRAEAIISWEDQTGLLVINPVHLETMKKQFSNTLSVCQNFREESKTAFLMVMRIHTAKNHVSMVDGCSLDSP